MANELKIGFVGVGQCGGNIANEFAKLGYPTVAINTAKPDLEKLTNIRMEHRLLISLGIQGAGKNPRKLTPRECARLQGFPEKFIITVSDTQAYKQFGNSVAVPVVRAVATRMVEEMNVLPETAIAFPSSIPRNLFISMATISRPPEEALWENKMERPTATTRM